MLMSMIGCAGQHCCLYCLATICENAMSQESTFLTREPVINKKRAITANRLIAHGNSVANVVETLNNLHEVWPTHHTVFVSLARLVPTPALMQWQPPGNTMIEIPVQALSHPLTQQLIEQLVAANIGICLSWYREGVAVPPDLTCRFTLVDARRDLSPHDAPGIPLAWGLEDEESFDEAVQAGFGGASGSFFLQGDPDNIDFDLAYGYAKIVRLINLVRCNADMRAIESLLQQDVALAWYLLRRINSFGFELEEDITSFRDAVNVLGYEALYKWLMAQVVTANFNPNAAAMMQTAITRGRFMEEIGASKFDEEGRANLFMVGSFSLLSDRMGESLTSVLADMTIPEDVLNALAFDTEQYAPYLRLARACERFDVNALQKQAMDLGVPCDKINYALVRALEMADSMQQG